jgi:hypothetical protein
LIKTHVRHSIAALLFLGYAASGCADADSASPAEKVADPSHEPFEYAPAGEQIEYVKATQEDELQAKGSYNRPFGNTYVQYLAIAPNQTISYSTSGGSVGVDPVLVLFRRHDNSSSYGAPFTQQVGLQTLAINDDTNGLHSAISYTNTSGRTENAWIMAFAYGASTGTVDLSGVGSVTLLAGSVRVAGSAGTAWTTGSTGDPWLFTFDDVPGLGNGNWQDDSNGGLESTIIGNSNLIMWYVANGWGSGTTTINN